MAKRNKILIALAAFAGAVVILFIALYFSIPHLLNSETAREKANDYFLKNTGGSIEFQKSDLHLLPVPHITFRQVSFTIPDKVNGRVEAVSVQPNIYSLIKGNLRLSNIGLESPDFTIDISKETEKTSLKIVEEKIRSLVRYLTATSPDLLIGIHDGKLALVKEKGVDFSFWAIQSRLIPSQESVSLNLACTSDLWDNLSFQALLHAEDLKTEGSFKLKKFRPHELLGRLSVETGAHIGDSEADLALKFETLGLSEIHTDMESSIPRLVILRGQRRLEMQDMKVQGVIETEPERLSVTLNQFYVTHPDLKISGKYTLDRGSGVMKVDLEEKSIDVGSIREIALAFAGDIPLVRDIFGIVRGGKISTLKVHTEGESIDHLGKTDNLRISGRIQGGAVNIPGKDLKFQNVAGDALIVKGILEGSNIEASLGRHRGSMGRLRIGLKGKNAPFYLDMWVNADLEEMPSLLKQKNLLTNEDVMREMDRLSETRGSARGRLVLGDRLDSLHVTIDVAEMNVATRYEPLPFPLNITGGNVFFDEKSLKVRRIDGSMGTTSFTQLRGQLDLNDTHDLEITDGKVRINTDEVYPWITSFGKIKPVLRDVLSIGGTVTVSSLNLKGRLYEPKDWEFLVNGEVKDLTLNSTFLPGKAEDINGMFRITPEELTLKNIRARMIDSVLSVSGTFREFPANIRKIDLSFQGELGPKVTEWVTELTEIPKEMKMRSPLSVRDSAILWEKGAKTTFDGNLTFGKSTRVSLKLSKMPDELSVNNIVIQDEDSDLNASFMLNDKRVDAVFKGSLKGNTINTIFANSMFSNSSLRGDFRTHIVLKDPMQSVADGTLEGKNIPMPWEHDEPFILENIAFEAKKNRIFVNSARFRLGQEVFGASGTLDTSPKWFSVDMDLSSDGIEWEKLENIFQAKEKKEDKKDAELLGDFPLRGTFRIQSGFFKYRQFKLEPFYADISFDGKTMNVSTKKAALCGVSTTGDIHVTDHGIDLDIRLSGRNLEFRPTVLCLSEKNADITGTFEIEANLKGEGTFEDIADKIDGSFSISAKDGKIYKSRSLDKTLDTLNETENFRGKFPDLDKQIVSYRTFTATGEIKKHIIEVEESILDASIFGIIARGEVDIENGSLDLNALVSPVSFAQRVISKIPILGHILGGNLVSVPVKIKGKISDPHVTFLSPSAIGSEFLGILKRTVKLPVTLIEPVLPGKEGK